MTWVLGIRYRSQCSLLRWWPLRTSVDIYRKLCTCLQAMYANTAVAGAMKGATKAMSSMNKVCFLVLSLRLEARIPRSLGCYVPLVNWIRAEHVSIFVILSLPHLSRVFLIELLLFTQQLEPAKQAKVMQEFQRQSAQMDMTVRHLLTLPLVLVLLFFVSGRRQCKCQPFWLEK